MSTSLEEIFIDSHRMLNFLNNNQLVQANGLCCRIEYILQDMLKTHLGKNEPNNNQNSSKSNSNLKVEDKKITPLQISILNSQNPNQNQNCKNIEDHPQWKTFKLIIKIKQDILMGQTKKALENTILLVNLIQNS